VGFNWYTALFVLGKGKNMEFTESLKKNYQFRFVYNRGKSIANRLLVMYVVRNGNRFGISVSKKVGNSVVRSRITRLLRESYRLSESKFLAGYDIVVIARASAKEATYREVESALMHLLNKQKLIKSE
jgi:ribonuclease P protein component